MTLRVKAALSAADLGWIQDGLQDLVDGAILNAKSAAEVDGLLWRVREWSRALAAAEAEVA